MEHFIHRDNIPSKLLPIFIKGKKTAPEWEELITQAVLSKTNAESEEGKNTDGSDDNEKEEEFGETSTIGSRGVEGATDEIEINFNWDYEEEEGDWVTMGQAHRQPSSFLQRPSRPPREQMQLTSRP